MKFVLCHNAVLYELPIILERRAECIDGITNLINKTVINRFVCENIAFWMLERNLVETVEMSLALWCTSKNTISFVVCETL
ncbi:MAG: hypothetical protein RBG13Loki_0374 [Promethearchaeota archaeon CR_4]|nr:MAG: hypothetical protein RBG13Loki_0374 [Candidatus Lokiarchaeota archaeon CR_4]